MYLHACLWVDLPSVDCDQFDAIDDLLTPELAWQVQQSVVDGKFLTIYEKKTKEKKMK